jgi:hypothetical protein
MLTLHRNIILHNREDIMVRVVARAILYTVPLIVMVLFWCFLYVSL